MTIHNAQLRGLGLLGSEGCDHDAPSTLISSAHPWREVQALATGTHSISFSIKVSCFTPVYLHGVAVLLNITQVRGLMTNKPCCSWEKTFGKGNPADA